MIVSVAEKVTVWPSCTSWSTLIRVVRSDLDFIVADVDKSLDGFDLSVPVFDCCTWRCIAVFVRGWHAAECTLGHCGHLCSRVNDSVDHALLVGELAHTVLGVANAVRECACRLCT